MILAIIELLNNTHLTICIHCRYKQNHTSVVAVDVAQAENAVYDNSSTIKKI
jgi:hypothetical protein